MTELKYGGKDVAKLMFGDVEVSGKPKFVDLSTKIFASQANDRHLDITRQELLNQKYTTLIVSYLDFTKSPNFWNFNEPFMLEEFLDTGVITIQESSKYLKMELKFIEDDVCLVYPNFNKATSCYISVSAY